MEAVAVVNKLHRLVLAWDYWQICERADEGGGVHDQLTKVPTTFPSMKEYKAIFETMILEELGAMMNRGVNEGEVTVPHKAVVAAVEERGEFTFARLALEPGISAKYSDNDLVVLCKDHPEFEGFRSELSVLGFCEAHEGLQSVRVKFFLSDDSQAGNSEGTARVRAVRAGLGVPGSCWWVLQLVNMSTLTREWVAMQHAHLCPFADILLAARPRQAHESKHMDIPAGMRSTMEQQCNESQMQALQAGLTGAPIVLIQGPPGTGKTRTILNLLSVVMHSATKGSLGLLSTTGGRREVLGGDEAAALWHRQSPWLQAYNPREDAEAQLLADMSRSAGMADMGEDCFGLMRKALPRSVGKQAGPKAHILVCAPSNSALDEIILRILKAGLMDKDGATFAPSIVRIGVNAHHSVKIAELDSLVDARLGGDQGSNAQSKAERDRMRLAVLDEAAIVFSTLSFAGSPIYQRKSRRFDVIIVDEAAQCVEPSILVPLVQGAKQAYLVGDPVQLPATVISKRAVEFNYDVSLFKRLQDAGYPVQMLDMQYRMHPNISFWPSREFYQGRLVDGPSVAAETVAPWHAHPIFGPFTFLDVAGVEDTPQSSASLINKAEASVVLALYRKLVAMYPSVRSTASIAVISPYKAQVKLLRETFNHAFSEEQARSVDINTIDGFQGREKDFVLFSAVRSKVGKKIGFVADERRINVGLTRARCSLIVVGHARALQIDQHWANLILSAKERRCFYRTRKPWPEWISAVIEGRVQPVEPRPEEMRELAPEYAAEDEAAVEEEGLADQVIMEADGEAAATGTKRKGGDPPAAPRPTKSSSKKDKAQR